LRRWQRANTANSASSADSAPVSSDANGEEGLTEFDGLAVGDETLHDFARGIGLDFIHQLHGFDDADYLSFFDAFSR
jgi:hypothetical protein